MEEDKTRAEAPADSSPDNTGSGDAPRTDGQGEVKNELNAYKSSLGRKISTMEQDVITIKSELREVLDTLREKMSRAGVSSNINDDDEVPKYITTPDDLEKYNTIKAKRERKKRDSFAKDYFYFADKYGDPSDPNLHEAVMKELSENSNAYPTYTDWENAEQDAYTNYKAAEVRVLKEKLRNPRVTVKGESPAGTGTTAVSRTTPAKETTVELDDMSRKFLKAVNASTDDEWVKKSLSRG